MESSRRPRTLYDGLKDAWFSGLSGQQQQSLAALGLVLVGSCGYGLFPEELWTITWQSFAALIMCFSVVFHTYAVFDTVATKWGMLADYMAQARHGEFAQLGVY